MKTRRRNVRFESVENTPDAVKTDSEGYEESRKRRIEENKLRLQKLGILDLSQKLKSEFRPPKAKSPLKKPQRRSPGPLLVRSSSRLKSMPVVDYSEKREKRSNSGKPKDVVIRIKEGPKPEIYAEDDQKWLGNVEQCGPWRWMDMRMGSVFMIS